MSTQHKKCTPAQRSRVVDPIVKAEAERAKNQQYYMERGAYIHKIYYLKKRYDIPSDVFKENINIFITDLKNLYYKMRVYVDVLRDNERKTRPSHTRNQSAESKEPDECVKK